MQSLMVTMAKYPVANVGWLEDPKRTIHQSSPHVCFSLIADSFWLRWLTTHFSLVCFRLCLIAMQPSSLLIRSHQCCGQVSIQHQQATKRYCDLIPWPFCDPPTNFLPTNFINHRDEDTSHCSRFTMVVGCYRIFLISQPARQGQTMNKPSTKPRRNRKPAPLPVGANHSKPRNYPLTCGWPVWPFLRAMATNPTNSTNQPVAAIPS